LRGTRLWLASGGPRLGLGSWFVLSGPRLGLGSWFVLSGPGFVLWGRLVLGGPGLVLWGRLVCRGSFSASVVAGVRLRSRGTVAGHHFGSDRKILFGNAFHAHTW